MEDEALNFFDSMFETIPNAYKNVPKDYREDTEMAHPKGMKKSKKSEPLSILELKERAQQKIENIQKNNREKSMAKIKQLTEEHKKSGINKMSKADKSMFEDMDKGNDSDDEPRK